MKKIKAWKHEKEFDTKTLITDEAFSGSDISEKASESESSSVSTSESAEPKDDEKTSDGKETREAVNLKTLSDKQKQSSDEAITQIYEPRPLTPDDDIYDDIIEQFASAPTKPKYWFEEFGDYWSCSCGHINRGDFCKSCGLERDLLRSLFILHKPAGAQGKLSKKLSKSAKEKIDKEEQQHTDRENRRKKLEETEDGQLKVVPIETDDSALQEEETNPASETSASGEPDPSLPAESGSPEDRPSEAEDKSVPTSKCRQDKDEDSQNSPAAKQPATKENTNAGANSDNKQAASKPPVPVIAPASAEAKRRNRNFRIKIIIAIVACLLLIALAGIAIYRYMAAPAMQYQDALQLQADGKYEKAIDKFEALGDYKDSEDRIWQCYCSLGDQYFEAGDFNTAIDTYNTAIKLKDDESLHDKIWKCYCGIGDQYFSAGEYDQALNTYYVAADLKDNDEIQDKINLTKFTYVKTYQGDRTAQVEKYMSDLMAIKYPGIQEIYDNYYAWHVNIVANTSADDSSTDVSTVSRRDTVYFHVSLSGGEPSEQILLYYEVTWPNGDTQIYDLDSTWESGSNITARFQYPIPLFGKEGKLTFKLYDKSTNEEMGSDSVTFKN